MVEVKAIIASVVGSLEVVSDDLKKCRADAHEELKLLKTTVESVLNEDIQTRLKEDIEGLNRDLGILGRVFTDIDVRIKDLHQIKEVAGN